jgi:hypothetical protein
MKHLSEYYGVAWKNITCGSCEEGDRRDSELGIVVAVCAATISRRREQGVCSRSIVAKEVSGYHQPSYSDQKNAQEFTRNSLRLLCAEIVSPHNVQPAGKVLWVGRKP